MTVPPFFGHLVLLIMVFPGQGSPPQQTAVRLYVLDGGAIDVSDMRSFSQDGRYRGERLHMANPAFLIRHPKGDLLWDTGHADALAQKTDGTRFAEWHYQLKTPIVDQLAHLGLQPADIEFLALSHLHPDHSGNANLFGSARFLVSVQEYTYMFSDTMKSAFGATYRNLETAETQKFQTTLDVFSDGTVVIHTLPGHTPGSAVLLLRLKKAGTLLLTGDLYTHDRGREQQTIPQFTHDATALRAARDTFEALAAKENARVVIQHSAVHFNALPVFPAYLE